MAAKCVILASMPVSASKSGVTCNTTALCDMKCDILQTHQKRAF